MKSLVVVRGGDKSLHMQWWCKPEDRSYDIALSYFGDNCDFWRDKCDYFHPFKGSKWEGLSDFIQNNQDIINQYDYIWFPDDDLWMHQKDLEHYFDLCRKYDFVVSQPALMKGSFYSWDITLQKPFSVYRETNFIEVMAPCFKVDKFKLFAPTFAENTSGWGLEWLWWKIAKENHCARFAIVDQTPMLHTREVGTAGSGGAKKTPADEMNELFQKYSLVGTAPSVLKHEMKMFDLLLAKLIPSSMLRKYYAKRPSSGVKYSSKRFS